MNASSRVGSLSLSVLACDLQLVGRAGGDDAAAIDQADAVAVLGLVEEVGRDHDRDAALDHGIDVRPELAASEGIDAGGGLVKEEDGRVVHDRAGECQPLLEAEGERGRRGC